jgi:hypothetical protein
MEDGIGSCYDPCDRGFVPQIACNDPDAAAFEIGALRPGPRKQLDFNIFGAQSPDQRAAD